MTDVKRSKDGAWARIDHMAWPIPGARLDALEHTLRYGDPTLSDLLKAASIISAYGQMIQDPRTKREHVVRTLRKVMKP